MPEPTFERAELVAPLLLNYDNNPHEGVLAFRRAIDAGVAGVADHPDVLVVYGLHLLAAGNWEEAETTLRKVLQQVPSHVLALYNLGTLLYGQKRIEEAQVMFEQTLALHPNHGGAHINLANVLKSQMQQGRAQELMRRAAQLEPHNYLPASFDLFESTYDINSTDATTFAKAKYAADLRCAGLQTPRTLALEKPWRKGERLLRVGFVSGDFKTHPVGFFLQNWLPYVDRRRMTLHAFSMLEVDDVVSQKLRPEFETWHSISKMSDSDVQALAAELGIDVLVDLSGHTDINRLPLFAARAAPIQISWLGWYATTGVVNMDYFLTDRISSPESSAAYHSERLLYVQATRLCMCPPLFAPDVAPLPALQNGYITFGSYQALAKMTDATLALWRKVLERIPNARLHLRAAQIAQSHILELLKLRLEAAGLPLDRVELLPPLPYAGYLESHQDIDLILDTIPFSGGTTTAEALWMGVPTLTLLGNTLIARQGASLVSAAGLADWVAGSEIDYIAKAQYWSEHLPELAALRSGLREQVRTSPLFDAPRFATVFTDALEAAAGA